MRSVLRLEPTSNYAVASHGEKADQADALANRLMGLSHPIQLLSTARETASEYDWPTPPRLSRRWFAVVTAGDQATLDWRTRTLRSALEGVGLRCAESDLGSPSGPVASTADGCGLDTTHRRSKDVPRAQQSSPVRSQVGVILSDAVRLSDDEYCATLVLRRWPREVAPGWLGQALAGDLPVDVALHVVPQDPQRIARFLKKQKAWQEDGGKDAANALGRRDAEVTRQKLIARTDRPVKVAVVLTVRATSRELLRQRVQTLQHEVGLALGDARLAKYEQDRGLEATLPNGAMDDIGSKESFLRWLLRRHQWGLIGAYRTLDCASVASTWIFQPATVNHVNGADLGTTHEGSMLVRLDPFDESLRSFGGLVTGSVGSGKSYFLKLLLGRLRGVEMRLVEHSDPPEYGGVQGLQTFSVADMSEAEQAAKLREYITDLWALARSDPKPRLLVLDELWAILKRPELAELTEEVARRGRKYGLALWIATQQVEELLASEWGRAVFDNAAIKVYLQQEDRDLEGLCKAAHLPDAARRLLRGAARGQALIHCGKMLILADIQASPEEHILVTTDPREVWNARNLVPVEDHANGSRPDLGRGVAAVART